MVKVIKYYFNLKNILLIIVFFVLIIFINLNLNNSFPDILSKLNSNSNKLNQNIITNQSFTNSNIYGLNNNFFYLKTKGIFVPINFFTEEKNILDNVIYEKDRNSLTLILNPLNLDNNSIVIQIPRIILDSKTSDNKDSRFEVSVDDKPSKFSEITPTNDSNSSAYNKTINSSFNDIPNRELSIGFGKDTKVIKISGADLSTTQKQIQINKDSKEKFQKLFPISLENSIRYLNYNMDGGNLKKISLNKNSINNKTLELFIDSFDTKGNLFIQIPRIILDSKTSDNKDSRFEVSVDDKPSKFSEITPTNDSNSSAYNKTINSSFNDIPNRELSIGFGKDTKVIKISGADLSTTQKQTQKQTGWFSIIIPIGSLSLAILLVVIIFFYKKGKVKFYE